MAIFRIVSEIQWNIGSKLQIFGTLPLFDAPIGVIPSEFHSRVSVGKTRMMGPPGDEKSLIVSLAVSIQYVNVTDRQTDRQTPVDRKDRAICIASRGKNPWNYSIYIHL